MNSEDDHNEYNKFIEQLALIWPKSMGIAGVDEPAEHDCTAWRPNQKVSDLETVDEVVTVET